MNDIYGGLINPHNRINNKIMLMERRIKLLEDLIMENFHILSGVPQWWESLLKGEKDATNQ